jgi:hypothetical protein
LEINPTSLGSDLSSQNIEGEVKPPDQLVDDGDIQKVRGVYQADYLIGHSRLLSSLLAKFFTRGV